MSEREDLKKSLLAKYEKFLDKMLADLPSVGEASLSDLERATGDLERATGDLGTKLVQNTLQNLVSKETEVEEKAVLCSDCGGKSHKRGKRGKQVISSQGEIELERQYYLCADCKKGFFSLDKKWGLNASAYSLEMGRQITWLSGLLPFEHCQAVFGELSKRLIPSSSIWRQSQYYGEKLWDFAQREAEQVRVERIVLPDARHDHEQKKGLAMDGGMVNVRGEGWREVKVAAVFDLETKLERDPHTEMLGDYAHACKIHYRAVLGTKQDFAAQAWALAVKFQVPTAKERLVIGDGAAWIWSLAEDLCPDAWQIVDWFHASQHLAQAAQKAFPSESEGKKRELCLKNWLDHLYFGRIEGLLEALQAHDCSEYLSYFETHKRQMQYLEFRENGLPLGSGVIESGVKQVKQRVAGAGMRWNAQSLNPMLLIAGSVLANDFQELWQEALAA